MKKRFAVTAAVIGASCAIVLSGCAGCAGCGKNSKNIASLNSNWYANTSYKKIQPTFTEGNDSFRSESLEYKVTLDKETASNRIYSVEYSEGVYTTEFYAAAFDKNKFSCEEFKGSYPEKLTAYCYKTQLDIPEVTFTFGSESVTVKGNSETTECWFLSVENYLQPLYSRIAVKSATPAEQQPTSLNGTYREVNYEYTTYYDYECNSVKTVVYDGSAKTEKNTDSVKNAPNTVFDVASLNIVVRASKLGEGLSQIISLYTPTAGLDSYTLASSSLTLKDEEKTAIKSVLEGSGLYAAQYDGEGNEKGLNTVAASVVYGGQLSGVTQTYWFTAIDNPRNNTGRTTMVKLATPLTYGLGTLNFTLNKVNSSLY